LFLIANDLSAIVLRDVVQHVVGVDPLGPAGARQGGAVVMDVYTPGAYLPHVTEPDATRPETDREGRGAWRHQ